MTNKIGWGQLGIVLALSRIFSEAANFPSVDINYGMQRFTVLLLSWLLLALTLIPLWFILRRDNNISMWENNRTAAVITVLYLTLGAITTATRLQFYASSTVFNAAPPWLIILFTALVCLYGIFKGLSAVARTGIIVSAGFAVLLLTVIIGVGNDIRLDYLYPSFGDKPSLLFNQVLTEYSKNAEAVMLAALYPRVRKTAKKSLYLWLSLSFGALIFMTFLYNTVIGEYLNVTNFPFYTLASLSDISILQRLDGIDVVIWIMTAVIKLSLLMLSVYSIIADSFRSKRAALIVSCISLITAALLSFYFSINTSDFLAYSDLMETGIPLFTVSFVFPLIISFGRKEKKHGSI